jgi:tape measure domain-containing protein
VAQNFEIEISAHYSDEEATKRLQKTNKSFKDLAETLDDLGPKFKGESTRKVQVQLKGVDALSGTLKVSSDGLDGFSDNAKKAAKGLKTLTGAENKSVLSIKQGLSAAKQKLSSLNKTSAAYSHTEQKVRGYQEALNKVNGVMAGSITQKRQLAARLQKLSESYVQGSADQRKYAAELKKINAEISGTNGPFRSFFGVLNKVASAQAGFVAFSAIIGTFTGKINELINQQKQLQGFDLALKNIGLSSVQASEALAEAAGIANRLGAPIQQVEKSFKRMIPALKAVGVNSKDSSKFIEAIAARTQTLGLNTEQSGRFLEAFAQVLSKGKLQAEELNQQISELDGAFRTQLADALNVTTQELEEMISNSQVTSKVFVEAVSKMANGAELLAAMVRDGNETVQQLQNQINNLKVNNLRAIAVALDPGIKAFFSIQKSIEQFIASVANSQFGALLADTFNNIVLAIRDFVNIMLTAVKAVIFILEPISGLSRIVSLLLRAIIPLTAAFVTVKIATAAYAAMAALASTATAGLGTKLKITSDIGMVAAQRFSNLATAVGRFIKTALPLALLSLLMSKITKAAKSTAEAFAGTDAALEETRKRLNANTQEIDKQIKKANTLKVILDGISKAFGFNQTADLFAGIQIKDRIKDMQAVQNALKDLQMTAFLGDMSLLSPKAFENLSTSLRRNKQDLEVYRKDLVKLREERERSGDESAFPIIKLLDQEIQLTDKRIKQADVLNGRVKEQADLRGVNVEELEKEVATMEKLKELQKREVSQEKVASLLLERKYTIDLGISTEGLAKTEILLERNRAKFAKNEAARAKERVQKLKQEGKAEDQTNDEYYAKLNKLTSEALKAELEAAEIARNVADMVTDEVERVFEAGTAAAESYAQAVELVASKVNSVKDSIKSTASTVKSAISTVFDRAIGQERSGSGRRKIEENRLRLLAKINSIENFIDKTKLQTAFTLQQLEIKTIQARIKGEAEIQRARGNTEAAANITRQASAYKEVLKLNELQFNVENQSLDLRKKLTGQALIDEAIEKKLFSQISNREIAEKEVKKALGVTGVEYKDILKTVKLIDEATKETKVIDEKTIIGATNSYGLQLQATKNIEKEQERISILLAESNNHLSKMTGEVQRVNEEFKNTENTIANMVKFMDDLLGKTQLVKAELGGTGGGARWMGGPVAGGQTYKVNDAGLGRESFMNKFGDVKLLPAGSNINWTAPSAGTILPAAITKQLTNNSQYNSQIANSRSKLSPMQSSVSGSGDTGVSGNLVKQMTAALTGSGGNQRITNNVTIQSQQPVTDASKIMTNVARMRLRNGRRI